MVHFLLTDLIFASIHYVIGISPYRKYSLLLVVVMRSALSVDILNLLHYFDAYTYTVTIQAFAVCVPLTT